MQNFFVETGVMEWGVPVTVSRSENLHALPSATRLRLLESLIEHTREGVLMCAVSPERNEPVRVIYGNSAFCAMTGFGADEIVGKSLAFLAGPETESAPLEQLMSAVSGNRSLSLELREYRKDRTSFWAGIHVVPATDDQTGLRYVTVVQNDITSGKVQQRVSEAARAELSRSNRALQEFASVASHDLQEPLRKIKAFGEFLAEHSGDALDAEGRDYLSRMLNAAGRMQTLINDLLTFARLATQVQPFVPVALSQVVSEVLSDLDAQITRTGGVVMTEPLATVDADARQMRMLFQNLISNALKFSRPGVAPVVTISGRTIADPTHTHTGAPGSWYEITVTDNGIGFDPRFGEKIFVIFQRLHRRQEYEGTGIGLAICREIAAFHHGSLTATSTPGVGATFTLRLPRNQKAQESAQ